MSFKCLILTFNLLSTTVHACHFNMKGAEAGGLSQFKNKMQIDCSPRRLCQFCSNQPLGLSSLSLPYTTEFYHFKVICLFIDIIESMLPKMVSTLSSSDPLFQPPMKLGP